MNNNMIFPVDQWSQKTEGQMSKGRLETEVPKKEANLSIINKVSFDAPENDIESLVSEIEDRMVDITVNYADWIDIAMALSGEFGEGGLSFFKRISRFYPKYDEMECEKVFESVRRNNANKVHLGTIFHIAKNYGVEIAHKMSNYATESFTKMPKVAEMPVMSSETLGKVKNDNVTADDTEQIPFFTNEVIDSLPDFLKSVLSRIDSEEDRDMILLTAIVVISSAFGKKIRGLYNNSWVYPNLYLMVVGNAGSKKGLMELVRYLVEPLHEHYRTIYSQKFTDYKNKMTMFTKKGKVKLTPDEKLPLKPKQMMHNIPVNSSAAAAFQALMTMNGTGLMFDTEIDTMVSVFKQDWGNFSELLRKNFHNETVEVYRKTDDEYYNIEEPAFSVALSGTKEQAVSLIKSVENGLFSRFMIFGKTPHLSWIDVRNEDVKTDNKEFFKHLGYTLFSYWKSLSNNQMPVTFTLSEGQWTRFNEFFKHLHENYVFVEGEDIHASLVRLGHIAYRMMMVLSLLRKFDEGAELTDSLECSMTDFCTSLRITYSLAQHMAQFFERLEPERKPYETASSETRALVRQDQEALYDKLPDTFTTAQFVQLASEQTPSICETTAKRWINSFLKRLVIIKVTHGVYKKSA